MGGSKNPELDKIPQERQERIVDLGTEEAFRSMLDALFVEKGKDMEYSRFLESKKKQVMPVGFDIEESDLPSVLFDFQRKLVRWAVKRGRAAVFAGTGLGKTIVQCAWANIIAKNTLIVCPLAVAEQTIAEAKDKLDLTVEFCERPRKKDGLWITNYEKLKHFVGSGYGAMVLDESSILKGIDSKTKALLIENFTHIPYRLCCTATPSPNDIAELANHAEFLGIARRQEMLSQFFVHDSEQSASGGWRLKGHAQSAFWEWVASWAMFVRSPSDIDCDDGPFILPPLNVSTEVVDTTFIPEGELFPRMVNGITGRSQARKISLDDRVERAAEIIDASSEQWLVWCWLNEEGQKLHKLLENSVLIEGSTPDEKRIQYAYEWQAGQKKTLISKVSIFGFGMNWQFCHNILYLGINDSYEAWHQSTRRCWRFGQKSPVNVVVITSKAEMTVLENVRRKETDNATLMDAVIAANKSIQLEELMNLKREETTYQTAEETGENWRVLLGDCIERIKEIEDESIGLTVSSPPFSHLYVYSNSDRDLGNSGNYQQFFQHMDYLIPELLRVTQKGRRCCFHVQQITTTLVHHGVIGLLDFRGDMIRTFVKHGWIYDGEIVIDKDPQASAIRSKSKGLTFVQKNKDSSWSRPALADFVLLFRKDGENEKPIKTNVTNEEWIQFARPIWYNIKETETLNGREARENKDERHIAPLQLGTIERCVRLWSNPGDVVFDCFNGIGSTGYIALKFGRKYLGIELKESYYKKAVENLKRAEMDANAMNLFGLSN